MPKSAANAKATRKEELAPDKNGLVVRSEPRHLLLTQLPPWFIAIFATIYLCGYSIEFFFYSYFGINDADSELLRMKYIETGVEFLILYLIIFLSLFFHVLNFRNNVCQCQSTYAVECYLGHFSNNLAIEHIYGNYFHPLGIFSSPLHIVWRLYFYSLHRLLCMP